MPAPSIEQASRDWLTQWWADSNLTPTPTLIATERPARAASIDAVVTSLDWTAT